MQETQVIDNYTSWFNDNYGITRTGEEPASLFDMRSLFPFSDSDSDSQPQETAYQVQQGRESEYDCCCWLPEYDSCCGGYWADSLFSGGSYSSDDDGCNDLVVKTEDSNQSEDQYQGYTSHCENEVSHPGCDYNPWSYYQYREDEDSDNFDRDEPRTTYGYRMDEVGLCEGIFGYFPCLLREQREYSYMQ